ncbi:hypothetical protein V8D89_004238 [Ganoderma adspersum]
MSPIINFNFIDGTTAAAADPEVIELDVVHVVEGSIAPGSADDGGVPENTVAAEDASAGGQASVVEGGVVLSVGDDEGGLEETGGSDDAGTLEVCGGVEDDAALGIDAST